MISDGRVLRDVRSVSPYRPLDTLVEYQCYFLIVPWKDGSTLKRLKGKGLCGSLNFDTFVASFFHAILRNF